MLGKNNDLEEGEEGEDGNTIVRDEELIKVLVSSAFIFHTNFDCLIIPFLAGLVANSPMNLTRRGLFYCFNKILICTVGI